MPKTEQLVCRSLLKMYGVVLLVLIYLVYLACSSQAITAPGCPARRGVTCAGHANTGFQEGEFETTDEILSSLRSQFCGCTSIAGNIRINLNNAAPRELNETDFDFFFYLEQISGHILLVNFPATSRIILPNLRLIRGQELVGQGGDLFALALRNVNVSEFIMPKLTEITRGNVQLFQEAGYRRLCSFTRVNWLDFMDDPSAAAISDNACTAPTLEELPDCSQCPGAAEVQFCWSSGTEYCQTLTKLHPDCTNCGTDRCFFPEDSSVGQCCNPHCAAGCDGPSAESCFACRDLDNNGTCVMQCPPEMIYDPNLFQVVPNPDFRLAERGICVDSCSDGLVKMGGECVSQCAAGYALNEDSTECISCDGVCPVECPGVVDWRSEIVNNDLIEELKNCTVITGSIVIGPVFGFDCTQLEVLSTVVEIKEVLRIDRYPLSTFPYLRNLRRVGTGDAFETINIQSCGGVPDIDISLQVTSNSMLTEIDLSSLEEVSGGGVFHFNNLELCYTGDILRLSNHTKNCVSSPRRDSEDCLAAGFICHPECASLYSCWGNGDHQCQDCRHYSYLNRCVANCSVVIDTLPPRDPGVLVDEGNLRCEPCHPQCQGGCNGTTADDCFTCANYLLRTPTIRTCVESCPVGTYQDPERGECLPCNQHCDRGVGCAGPLPILDQQNGCLDCDLVQLTVSGFQDICVMDSCSNGYYRTILTADLANASITGDLQIGSDICLPCDELCAVCTGPGVRIGESCFACSTGFVNMDGECTRECSGDTTYFQLVLTGITDCESWRASNLASKDRDLVVRIVQSVATRCGCGFTESHITDRTFHCFPSSPQSVTYHGLLYGTQDNDAMELVSDIQEWVSSGVSIPIQFISLSVDEFCAVTSSTAVEQCLRDDVTTMTTQTTSDVSGSNTNVIFIVALSAAAVLLVAMVIVVSVILLKRRCCSSHKDDMSQNPVAMKNIVAEEDPEYEEIPLSHIANYDITPYSSTIGQSTLRGHTAEDYEPVDRVQSSTSIAKVAVAEREKSQNPVFATNTAAEQGVESTYSTTFDIASCPAYSSTIGQPTPQDCLEEENEITDTVQSSTRVAEMAVEKEGKSQNPTNTVKEDSKGYNFDLTPCPAYSSTIGQPTSRDFAAAECEQPANMVQSSSIIAEVLVEEEEKYQNRTNTTVKEDLESNIFDITCPAIIGQPTPQEEEGGKRCSTVSSEV